VVTFLGIDIGSSAVKAATFDVLGRQLQSSRVECPSSGETDPRRWHDAALSASGQLDLNDLHGIGICGRGGTNVLLDAACEPIAPSWEDHRHGESARALRVDRPELSPQAVNLLAKAEWWGRNRANVEHACSAKDYVGFRLTGELATDPASGGSAGRCDPLVVAREPWSILGRTRGGSSIPHGVPVAVGWHDGAAATFGAGAAFEGAAPVTLGTHAVYRVVTRTLPQSLRQYWDLTPGLTVTGGDILAGGRAFEWARDLFPGADAGRAPAGSNGVVFLPQLSGRIAPDVVREARGGWHGLSPVVTGDHLLRAVCEGVAFALRQVRDWLASHGLAATETFATGGGAHNPLQAQILADVLGTEVNVASVEEGCRGAALLGAVAAGELTLEHARTLRPESNQYAPQAAAANAYPPAFERFLRLQSATDSVFRDD
jgi:gluconokinase